MISRLIFKAKNRFRRTIQSLVDLQIYRFNKANMDSVNGKSKISSSW